MKPINHLLFMEDREFKELTQTNLSIKTGVDLKRRKRRQNTSPAQQNSPCFCPEGASLQYF